MAHECHDPNCTHDPAIDAATAVIAFVPATGDFDERLRRAVAELVQERMGR